jgi:aldehyde dehydrogenase (NAD+)
VSLNPADNTPIARVRAGTVDEYKQVVAQMDKAKPVWAEIPMPVRGELVRKIGDALRANKDALGAWPSRRQCAAVCWD